MSDNTLYKKPALFGGSIRLGDADTIVVKGKIIRIAFLRDEEFLDVTEPGAIVARLISKQRRAPDMFTFRQILPETKPKFGYYFEWEPIASMSIKNYDHWLRNQISSDTRNKVKKATKKGVDVRVVGFNDDLVEGIMEIFNETPVRRGVPFWHYGKDFETVKEEWSRDLDKSVFIGAYYKESLIGYIKLVFTENNYANMVQFIAKIEHRDKYANNALIAKAVEVCANRNVPFLTYTGVWRRADHGEFQRRVGFEKILLPRYYIPLSMKGRVALKLGLYRNLRDILPDNIVDGLMRLRSAWYEFKFRKKISERIR